MIENYMDYAQDQCMNMFTQDQSDMMRSMLETARIDLADGSIPPTGIDSERIDASEISIFPNPSNGDFQIQFPSDLILENAQVFDLKGRLVISIVHPIENGQLSIANAKTGAYMLRFNFTDGAAVKRLLIQ